MATPGDGSSTAEPEQSTPIIPTIIPAPYTTNEQHVCFICLQNDTDTPNATWVNTCPCSLEAHEHCMLRWIAEVENDSARPKDGLKCPACKAPINVDEPYDPVVALRDGLYRRYSRLSPYILLMLVSGGTIAGSAWYGQKAASIFAGPDALAAWMGSRARRGMPSVLIKTLILSSIGPSLVVTRWLSSLGIIVLLPCSVLYSTILVAEDNLPTWPPSGQWAMALMPYVHLSYTFLYYDLFGPLERRLNRALRGRPPTDDAANPRDEALAGVVVEPAAAAAGPRNDEEADGIWGNVANLSRAIVGLFNDWPAGAPREIEVAIAENVEIRIGGRDDDQFEDDVEAANHARDEEDLVGDEDDQFQILANDGVEGLARRQQLEPPLPAAEQLAPPPLQQNQQGQNQNPRRDNNNDAPPAPVGVSYFGAAINSIVTSLLFPAISYGMGELIRATLPKAWVTRGWRRPAGLLQEQWGRSLVGGCLFVVLKDAIALYTKYRRVQVKANRRVRNVERRRPSGEGEVTC